MALLDKLRDFLEPAETERQGFLAKLLQSLLDGHKPEQDQNPPKKGEKSTSTDSLPTPPRQEQQTQNITPETKQHPAENATLRKAANPNQGFTNTLSNLDKTYGENGTGLKPDTNTLGTPTPDAPPLTPEQEAAMFPPLENQKSQRSPDERLYDLRQSFAEFYRTEFNSPEEREARGIELDNQGNALFSEYRDAYIKAGSPSHLASPTALRNEIDKITTPPSKEEKDNYHNLEDYLEGKGVDIEAPEMKKELNDLMADLQKTGIISKNDLKKDLEEISAIIPADTPAVTADDLSKAFER